MIVTVQHIDMKPNEKSANIIGWNISMKTSTNLKQKSQIYEFANPMVNVNIQSHLTALHPRSIVGNFWIVPKLFECPLF